MLAPQIPLASHPIGLLFRGEYNALVLLALDHLERVQKVLLARLHRCRVLGVTGQVGVDELDEAVEILGRDLYRHCK